MKFFAPAFLAAAMICLRCHALELPVPPEQYKSWKSDPAIPTNIVSAAEELFAQGFPDPRGCEYREIEVTVSDVWNGKPTLAKTRGWVLPKKSGTNQFAICWNGLIYPVVKVSVAADLHAEVTNSNLPVSRGFIFGGNSAVGEVRSVNYANALSTRVLLLLRCGETDAVLKNWSSNRQMVVERVGRSPAIARINDPYLEFAGDWVWAMFDRMISAHQRGDETLALATARQLAEVQPKIETECARRGFQKQRYYDNEHQGQEKPYLDFLGQLSQILADLQRRAKEPAKTDVIEAGITNFPNQFKRIAALVDNLDCVSAHQWSQPGWVNLAGDPIVTALINEGDAAVEPLINCLETDKRLTRSVGFGRDFFRSRTVIPVHDVARFALESILRDGFNNDAEIRAYWNKYKSLKLEDRWYAILNDDSARSRWAEAAANIVQPENITRYPGGFSMEKRLTTNETLCGECLREKQNPSVTELFIRRALEIPTNNVGNYDLSFCCQMAEYLAQWDIHAALPVAKTLSARASTVMKYSDQPLGDCLTKLSIIRARTGDPTAFNEYADWIVTTKPEQFNQWNEECLAPFKISPTNSLLQTTAEKLFGNTNSAWGNLPWKNNYGWSAINTNLVPFHGYRMLLCRELEKTNICATVTWSGHNYLSYNFSNYQSGSFQFDLDKNSEPTNGPVSEIRWCDWIALSFARSKTNNTFNPFEPIELRNKAIAEIEAALKK